ncbi:MAG: FAD-dependent oxidoreductase [Deltaproteobacteria bacterium]
MEAGRSPNINIITRGTLRSVTGEIGRFEATIRRHPRYVNEERCTGCGTCTAYCPVSIPDLYNDGLGVTKALHMDYQQAIPSAFYVDETACLFLNRKECKQCERVCMAGAIDFTQGPEDVALEVGAIILAPGFGRISKGVLARYGYGRSPDVITGVELERLTSTSGPTLGEITRLSDGSHPRRIAFLQCIGSRDIPSGNNYCSSVCCMYAVKEALVAKDHDPELEITLFYMDMRTQGKGFDDARIRAKESGIRFVRSRVSGVKPLDRGLQIQYVTSDGTHRREMFDMVILPEGLESPQGAGDLSAACGIDLNTYEFCQTAPGRPLESSRSGIFVAGAFQAPKDVPDSVTDASGAAGLAAAALSPVRNTRVKIKTYPEEIAVEETPRIGVFVCFCGSNIGGVVRVPEVAEYAATLDDVVFVDTNLYSCAQNTQQLITEKIEENRLNRVVVAACTPRTHEPLFQETLKNAGLNRSLFEMANIRDHCSWVHAHMPEEATQKAKDQVKMAVAKARLRYPMPEQALPVIPRALVLGGGLSGMIAALGIAGQGFDCTLLETASYLGGNLTRIPFLFSGEDAQALLARTQQAVMDEDHISVHTDATIQEMTGYVGNFKTTVRTPTGEETVHHGVTIVATGGVPYQPRQYAYGESDRIVTQLELGDMLLKDQGLEGIQEVVMIQCVGSRGEDLSHCSKVCCGQAVNHALLLMDRAKAVHITILYRDMRTYGFMEDAYQKAREAGVVFVPYERTQRPRVSLEDDGLRVLFMDPILDQEVTLNPDLLVLSVGIVPSDVKDLARGLKIPQTKDGFFLEAHPKLRPVEFSVDGIYLCGLAHGPKPVSECIAQAQAAASKACTLLARGSVDVEPIVSRVDPAACIGCGLCIDLCPYTAIHMVREGKKKRAETITPSCKGCGICASHCPAMAISMGGFTNEQIMAQIQSLR